MANDAYDNSWADKWALKQAEAVLAAEAQQRRNNSTGHPHELNGRCQAERPNARNDFAGPCNAPLHAYPARRGEPAGTYCPVLSCPAYDLPTPPQPGVTLRFPEVQ